jgi:squalene synthase HpnC
MKFSKIELINLTKLEPETYSASSINEANNFCKSLATTHYENFPVGSILIEKSDRAHFYSVYAFSRIADDIADEDLGLSSEEKIVLLNDIYNNLIKHINGAISTNPVFIALKSSIEIKNLPPTLFKRLIDAFIADSIFIQPETWEDVFKYCSNSANPIGELVLRITGNYNEKNAELSDNICTALQLANFWQDISIDLTRGRIYIPNFILKKYEISKENLLVKKINANFILCLGEVYSITRELFYRGENLHNLLIGFRIKKEIKITWLGGMEILRKTEQLGDSVINLRPKLTKSDYIGILIKSLF